MPTPITEIGVSLRLVEKAPVDNKNVVDTLAEAIALAYEGYNPYIKELQGFYFFTVANGNLLPAPGVTLATVQALIADIVDSSPATLDTLKELAEAVNNDPNFGAGMIANISSINTKITQILGVIAVPPVYLAPSASITSQTQTVEKGTNLANITLNIGFTQRDAGAATGYELLRNGSAFSSTQNNSVTENNIQSAITFIGRVSYAEGLANKLNNLGIEDGTGHILAGTVSSATQTITPKLRIFYGSASAVPADSAAVRALPSNVYDGTASIDLVTGTTNKIFVVAIPSNRSITSVIDITNLNLNITANYVVLNASFTVNDIGGNAQTYKLIAMQSAIPYGTSATHRITIA